mmetsp:Transcript_59028/g.138953  ORF Transcript_59028/g.138953 Transcript_59028/m.138953 type:complete len:216 (-) Transcript_59028:717-1364(-)
MNFSSAGNRCLSLRMYMHGGCFLTLSTVAVANKPFAYRPVWSRTSASSSLSFSLTVSATLSNANAPCKYPQSYSAASAPGRSPSPSNSSSSSSALSASFAGVPFAALLSFSLSLLPPPSPPSTPAMARKWTTAPRKASKSADTASSNTRAIAIASPPLVSANARVAAWWRWEKNLAEASSTMRRPSAMDVDLVTSDFHRTASFSSTFPSLAGYSR